MLKKGNNHGRQDRRVRKTLTNDSAPVLEGASSHFPPRCLHIPSRMAVNRRMSLAADMLICMGAS